MSVSANSIGVYDVTFPKAFGSVPKVVASIEHSYVDVMRISVSSITKTGCKIHLQNELNTAAIMYFDYIAVL